MAKPSLLQSLLNRPSQSYSYPPAEKKYHSTKGLMVRIAAEAHIHEDESTPETGSARSKDTMRNVEDGGQTSHQLPPPPTSGQDPESDAESTKSVASGDEIYFTPPTSPRVSRALSALSAVSAVSTLKFAPPSRSSLASFEDHTLPPISTRLMSNSTFPSSSSARTPIAQETQSTASKLVSGSSHKLRRVAKQVNYANQDWAKDVKWLVHPAPSEAESASKDKGKSVSPPSGPPPTATIKSSHFPTSFPTAFASPASRSKPLPKTSPLTTNTQTRSKSNPSKMTALPEELDEVVEPRRVPNGLSDARSQASSSTTTTPTATRPPRGHSPAKLQRARRPQQRTVSDPTTPILPPITTPVTPMNDLPSKGTPGYTSLTLAHAPLPGNSKGTGREDASGRVDLTRSGVAQTTMATVEVVRGISETVPGATPGRFSSLKRLGTLKKRPPKNGSAVPALTPTAGLRKHEDSGIEFTNYRSSPDHVPSGGVLVQVWAVAVDVFDWRLVRNKLGISLVPISPSERIAQATAGLGRSGSAKSLLGFGFSKVSLTRSNSLDGSRKGKEVDREMAKEREKKAEVGFVPGRAFVGRVIEFGWNVRDGEGGKKGEWVIGLLEARKCGGLSQFITVDRRRIHVVGHPYIPQTPSLLLSQSTSEARPRESLPPPGNIQPPTLAELALVPLCGLPAWRVVRTFEADEPEGGRRILVLGGERGVGGLAGRMLISKGWSVEFWASSAWESTAKAGEVEDRLIGWGCSEVHFSRLVKNAAGERLEEDEGTRAVRILQRLLGDGEIYDAILDCVGGKEVWEAGERLLSVEDRREVDEDDGERVKQFTTLFGDHPWRPIPSASDHYRAGVRTRSTGGRYYFETHHLPNQLHGSIKDRKGKGKSKGKGKVGYAWVSVASDTDWDGEDVRGSIAGVLAERERLSRESGSTLFGDGVGEVDVMSFDKTPDVFGERAEEDLFRGGGMVVSKIVA